MIDIEADLDDLGAAVEKDKNAAAQAALGGDTPPAEDNGVVRWMKNLPRNIGVGLIDAAVNTYDVAPDVLPGASATTFAAGKAKEEAKANLTPHQRRMGAAEALEADPLREAVLGFRNELAKSANGTADAITQGAAQFMIPFMGWSKAFNVFKAATTAGKVAGAAAAESATMATAFDPHGGRLADLVAFGKQTEGKLADTLNAITPDGSALNAYIDYMSSREDEGEAEGRFKNVVDGLAGSVAVAGLLKVGAVTFKTARMGLENVVPSGSGSGIPNQEGMVAFHGTPHDFDAFDLSKIGTGEGNQVYGHGLYFAEGEGTAKHYRGALARRGVTPGSAMENAMTAMEVANYDAKEAYTTLMNKAVKTQDAEWRETLIKAADKIKAGNVKQLGKLMTVDIPDEAVAKMLDHDLPLTEQPEVLSRIPEKDRNKLQELLDDNDQGDLQELTGNQLHQLIQRAISEDYLAFTPVDGNFDNLKKAAAEYLNGVGIPGIRYLDRGSRGKGAGTRNLVLFDDKLVTITKKE